MSKLKITCDICGEETKLPLDELWSNYRDITLCSDCAWPKIGNRLRGVFGFGSIRETAEKMGIPKRTLDNLNDENAGRNIVSLARHIVRLAVNLSPQARKIALDNPCPWPRLADRIAELFFLKNATRASIVFYLSGGMMSNLNNKKAGDVPTRLAELLIVLTELLPEQKRRKFILNMNFLLDD